MPWPTILTGFAGIENWYKIEKELINCGCSGEARTTTILWSSFNKQQEPKLDLSFEEIERSINDSANAARLLAATELLADYPDYKEIVENEYRYIAQTYPDTPAAEIIKLKIQ